MSYERIKFLSTNNSEFESHSKNTEMYMDYQKFPKLGSQVLLRKCERPGRVSHHFFCLNYRKLTVALWLQG